MQESVFTKIINGQLPCHKVFEDAAAFAFLDIHPVQPGQTLVVPKKQVQFVWDLDQADYAALMDTVRRVAQQLRAVLRPGYVGVIIEGVEIPHAHVKLIPFSSVEQFRRLPDTLAEPDHAALAEMAAKLAF